MKDHTGKQIKAGQLATMDSSHSKGDDWEGIILEKDDGLYFKYLDDGDTIKITDSICRYIEVDIDN